MFSTIRDAQQREEGFTLIELLVVVIIIGILAAIAIPTFMNQRERGWQAELTSTLRNVALEVEAAGTASGGDYSGVDQPDITGFANDIQGAAADPVEVTLVTSTDNEFCLTATHDSLDGANQAYDSDAGGLVDFAADGSASCA